MKNTHQSDQSTQNAAATEQPEGAPRRRYHKPRVEAIELRADEVLAKSCKMMTQTTCHPVPGPGVIPGS